MRVICCVHVWREGVVADCGAWPRAQESADGDVQVVLECLVSTRSAVTHRHGRRLPGVAIGALPPTPSDTAQPLPTYANNAYLAYCFQLS